jgi:hypothetical protein
MRYSPILELPVWASLRSENDKTSHGPGAWFSPSRDWFSIFRQPT